MSNAVIASTPLGGGLTEVMTGGDITPGSAPSYQLCKSIYLYHPLGAKIAESPIRMAQSQNRDITISDSPEDRLREAFEKQWDADGCSKHIFNCATLSRVYGIATVALMVEGVPTSQPVDYKKLWDATISFNILDPLNTAGSLVLNQNANAMDFLKTVMISVQGQSYHPTRTCILMNESPIFLGYTSSAFGYVGRSTYQRALYMLRSYINTMLTDDLITRKAGVLVAMLKAAGSIIDNIMAFAAGVKRSILKEAEIDNVISIEETEKVESINLQNLEGPYALARKNILENIAVAADMPAKMLNNETFAEGFGEGTEDAKNVARYVDQVRRDINPLYTFFDDICQHRAWNPEFYKSIQRDFPEEYGDVTYEEAFYTWTKNYRASWPSLLTEPDSEKIKVEDVKLKAIIAIIEVFAPMIDPDINLPMMLDWAAQNINQIEMLFSSPMEFDMEALKQHAEQQKKLQDEQDDANLQKLKEPDQPKPFAANDSQPGRKGYYDAIATLIAASEAKKLRLLERDRIKKRA